MNASGEASGHSCFQPQVFRQFLRQVHPTQAPLVLAPWPNRAFVDGFDHFHSGLFVLERVPSKGKQFAQTQGVRHVEFEQDTITQRERAERIPQLLPRERGLVRLAQMSRRADLPRGL